MRGGGRGMIALCFVMICVFQMQLFGAIRTIKFVALAGKTRERDQNHK
jgi:hypothetical protein